jgi:hypothetical protein
VSITSSSGRCTPGSAACSTPFQRLNSAVLAPMPSASERIATAVKPGRAAIVRSA